MSEIEYFFSNDIMNNNNHVEMSNCIHHSGSQYGRTLALPTALLTILPNKTESILVVFTIVSLDLNTHDPHFSHFSDYYSTKSNVAAESPHIAWNMVNLLAEAGMSEVEIVTLSQVWQQPLILESKNPTNTTPSKKCKKSKSE